MINQMCLINEKYALLRQIEVHECNASRDSGCECSWWKDKVKQINHELELLKNELSKVI